MTIKAIETVYKGYKFRSRLEARWAIFFDSLGIEWEYEPEGYKLNDGRWYLPDFYLPYFNGGMFVEVKPDRNYDSKAQQFANDSGNKILMAVGCPDFNIYKIYTNSSIEDVVFDWKYIGGSHKNESRLYYCCGEIPSHHHCVKMTSAINNAKQANFN